MGAAAAPPEWFVDLRSDTVTLPTSEMRKAMAEAEVDDDVLGADPTVARLEKQVAVLLGKEAGLFVPSGTMGNLIAVCCHCDVRGSEAILGDQSHIYLYEQGGCATLGGVHPRSLPNAADGTISLSAIESAVRPLGDDHCPVTRLLCLENTHGHCGGRVLPAEYIDAAGEICRRHAMALHVDGARILNAAAALGLAPARLCAAADSVSVCLSKGVGAPVGSVIVGSHAFVRRCRRLRKALGGGMRQGGVLAAPALVALRDWQHQLLQDHSTMQRLCEALARVPGLSVRMPVESNICFVSLAGLPLGVSGDAVVAELAKLGVRAVDEDDDPRLLRVVTHRGVAPEMVPRIAAAYAAAAERAAARAV